MPFLGISTPQNFNAYLENPTELPGDTKNKESRIIDFIGRRVQNEESFHDTLVVFFDDSASVLAGIEGNQAITTDMPNRLMVYVNPYSVGLDNRYGYTDRNLTLSIESITQKINHLMQGRINKILVITDLDGTLVNTLPIRAHLLGGLSALPDTPEEAPFGYADLTCRVENKTYAVYDTHLIDLFRNLTSQYQNNFELWGLTDREVDHTNPANTTEHFRIPGITNLLRGVFPQPSSNQAKAREVKTETQTQSSKKTTCSDNPYTQSSPNQAEAREVKTETPTQTSKKTTCSDNSYTQLFWGAALLLFASAGAGAALYYFDVFNLKYSIIAASAAFCVMSLFCAIGKHCLSKDKGVDTNPTY